MTCLRQQNFDVGKKSGPFLASKQKFTKTEDLDGKTNYLSEINNIFSSSYFNLYTPEQDINTEDIDCFLRNVCLPIVTAEQHTTLLKN